MTDKEIIATTEILAVKGFIYPTGREVRDGKTYITILKIKAGRKAKPKQEVKDVKAE